MGEGSNQLSGVDAAVALDHRPGAWYLGVRGSPPGLTGGAFYTVVDVTGFPLGIGSVGAVSGAAV